MPKYALLRDLDPGMTRADMDGAALNTISAQRWYSVTDRGTESPDHGVRWIRTYWEQGGSWGLCLYESPNLEILHDFEIACDMPYVEAYQIDELHPQGAEAAAERDDGTRLAVTLSLPDEVSPEVAIEALGKNESGSARSGARWLRTYWDSNQHLAFAFFDAEPEDLVDGAGASHVARVVEIHPGQFQ